MLLETEMFNNLVIVTFNFVKPTSEVAKTFSLFSLTPALYPAQEVLHIVPTQANPMTPKDVFNEKK